MHFNLKLSRVATAFVLAMIFVLPHNLLAEGPAHVVCPAGLAPAARGAAAEPPGAAGGSARTDHGRAEIAATKR